MIDSGKHRRSKKTLKASSVWHGSFCWVTGDDLIYWWLWTFCHISESARNRKRQKKAHLLHADQVDRGGLMLLFKSSASEGTHLTVQICYDPLEKHWHFWASTHSHAFYVLSQRSSYSSTSNATENLDYQSVWKCVNFATYASRASGRHAHVQRTGMS